MSQKRAGNATWVPIILELFVIANLAFLAVDVFLAHSVNGFAHLGEWISVLFSIIASLLMLLTLFIGGGRVNRLVGIGGLLFHLEALGGLFGNFVLCLCDHAQNGFFNRSEWIPIFTSAIGVGFLMTALLQPIHVGFLKACIAVLIVNGLVGVLGFYLHLSADWQTTEWIYGPPPFAPLLLTDLALLGMLGIFNLVRKGQTVT